MRDASVNIVMYRRAFFWALRSIGGPGIVDSRPGAVGRVFGTPNVWKWGNNLWV